MIVYDNRALRPLLFSRAGTVVFSSYVLVPSLFSTILCALILLAPDMQAHLIISSSVVRIYAQVLGFIIVFRTSISFNRYFDGVGSVKAMFSMWREAFISLCVFIEVSTIHHQEKGSPESVEELITSKARLLHWFSLLLAVALSKICALESYEGLEMEVFPRDAVTERPSAVNGLPSDVFTGLGFDAQVGHSNSHTFGDKMASVKIILGHVTKQEKEALNSCQDEVLCIVRWLLLEVSGHAITGRISVPPPIVSRAYQELSNGMLHFFMAMKIVLVPFPFAFAQFLQYALLFFVVLCPFAVLPSIEEEQLSSGLVESWPCLVVNFLAVSGFVALNEIAIELENPFGENANRYPFHQEQWWFVSALEDCFFEAVPRDFNLACLDHASNAEQEVEMSDNEFAAADSEESAGAPKEPVAVPEPCPVAEAPRPDGPADVHALAPTFEALQDMVSQSVQAVQDLGMERRKDVSLLQERMRELLPVLLPPLSGVKKRSSCVSSMTFSDSELWSFGGDAEGHDGQSEALSELMQKHSHVTASVRKLLMQVQNRGASLGAMGSEHSGSQSEGQPGSTWSETARSF